MEDRKNMVINFSPFVLDQDVYCYIDGECKEHKKTGLTDLPVLVETMKKKYDIHKISLVGSQDYLAKFRDELVDKTTFNQCEVEIITR